MFIHSDGLYSCSLCVLVPTVSRATKSSIIWQYERLTTGPISSPDKCFSNKVTAVYENNRTFYSIDILFGYAQFGTLMCIAMNSQTPLVRVVDFFYNNFTTIRTSR